MRRIRAAVVLIGTSSFVGASILKRLSLLRRWSIRELGAQQTGRECFHVTHLLRLDCHREVHLFNLPPAQRPSPQSRCHGHSQYPFSVTDQGTWQFMSTRLPTDPGLKHTIIDLSKRLGNDLEQLPAKRQKRFIKYCKPPSMRYVLPWGSSVVS